MSQCGRLMLDPVKEAVRFARHRTARWLVPAGLAAGAAVVTSLVAVHASPDPLPEITATQLLTDARSSSVNGFTATMVARVSLGLPQLPAGALGGDTTSMTHLLSGSHTVRVWYGGPDRQRLALLGPASESDLFHSGTDLWEWDSDTRVATHTVLPPSQSDAAGSGAALPSLASLTPDQLAAGLLSLVDSTTKVSLGGKRTVADRSAYDLVLTPRAAQTRVGSVHIAVDGDTKLPLAVEVYPRSSRTAAVDVSYSAISFAAPPSSYFVFTAPPGATVLPDDAAARGSVAGPGSTLSRMTRTGTGWTTVIQYRITPGQLTVMAGSALSVLPQVHGAWGSGYLLAGALFSVLVTGSGQVFVGAVDPSELYAAAADQR